MIELRSYIPEDYIKIKRKQFDLLTLLKFPDPKVMAQVLTKGPAYTGIVDGEILACGGIMPFWKGVGEAWVISSEIVCKHPLFFAKTIWRKLNILIKEMELERIQTIVDAENKISMNWVERMGFKNEGLMRKYINGKDYYRYALIRED